ncbi:MAG: GNAT family N-acetyltransferase [Mycobacterium leprae]
MTESPLSIRIPEELVGERIIVRPYREEDAPAFWEAIEESRAHLAPWLPWVHYYQTPADVPPFLIRSRARWLLREDMVVGIFERATGRFLGGSGLHRIDWSRRSFEIGYWLRKSAEGRGYVSETVQLLTRLAFDTLAAYRVEIRMNVKNDRSRHVPERLGFVHEGILRCVGVPETPGGRPCDDHVFALIPEEYSQLPWRTQQ